MRTKTLIASAILMAGLASSSAQVFSVNVVGYVNKSLTTGFNLVANPLSNGDNNLQTVIPSAEDESTVYVFNGTGYQSDSYLGFLGGWTENFDLSPGVGFFFDAQSDSTLTFVGEVEQGTLDVNLPEGFSLAGSRVPTDGSLSTMGFPAVDGLTVYKFVDGGFTSSSYLGFLSAFDTDLALGVAEGFFVEVPAGAGEVTWSRDFSVQ